MKLIVKGTKSQVRRIAAQREVGIVKATSTTCSQTKATETKIHIAADSHDAASAWAAERAPDDDLFPIGCVLHVC